MIVEFDKRFLLDVKKVKDKELSKRTKSIILHVEQSVDVTEINTLKKLDQYAVYYRIKIKLDIKRDYRLGMIIRGTKVRFVRCLPRNRIYNKFP